jgi:hypothetical protein
MADVYGGASSSDRNPADQGCLLSFSLAPMIGLAASGIAEPFISRVFLAFHSFTANP